MYVAAFMAKQDKLAVRTMHDQLSPDYDSDDDNGESKDTVTEFLSKDVATVADHT